MTSPEKKVNKISSEVAQDQLDLLIDYYEIDTEIMQKEMQSSIKFALDKILNAIQKCRLEITTDNGLKIRQIFKNPVNDVTEIVYGPVTLKSKTSMSDKDSQYEKIYKLMASISGDNVRSIHKMSLVDGSLLECLGLVFLQV